jgi:predicted nucleic acid-binding protein
VDLLHKNCILVPESTAIVEVVSADPPNEMFLAAALDSNADVIVSGDKDLLEIESFRGIAIIFPRQFLDRIRG